MTLSVLFVLFSFTIFFFIFVMVFYMYLMYMQMHLEFETPEMLRSSQGMCVLFVLYSGLCLRASV